MRTRRNRSFLIAASAIAMMLLLFPALAGAQTQRQPVASGTLAPFQWEAVAIPTGLDPLGYHIMLDIWRESRAPTEVVTHAYGIQRVDRRGLRASESRVPNRPTRRTVVVGNVGKAVWRVKVLFADGTARGMRTVPAPRDWRLPVRNYRFFAVAKNVAKPAKTKRMARRVIGFNRKGERIAALPGKRVGLINPT